MERSSGVLQGGRDEGVLDFDKCRHHTYTVIGVDTYRVLSVDTYTIHIHTDIHAYGRTD